VNDDAQTMSSWPPRMNSRLASQYLLETYGVKETAGTLNRKRCTGGGPEFEKYGRHALYTPPSLDQYVRGRLSGPKRSTSDPGP
jgi:hypothetical protein